MAVLQEILSGDGQGRITQIDPSARYLKRNERILRSYPMDDVIRVFISMGLTPEDAARKADGERKRVDSLGHLYNFFLRENFEIMHNRGIIDENTAAVDAGSRSLLHMATLRPGIQPGSCLGIDIDAEMAAAAEGVIIPRMVKKRFMPLDYKILVKDINNIEANAFPRRKLGTSTLMVQYTGATPALEAIMKLAELGLFNCEIHAEDTYDEALFRDGIVPLVGPTTGEVTPLYWMLKDDAPRKTFLGETYRATLAWRSDLDDPESPIKRLVRRGDVRDGWVTISSVEKKVDGKVVKIPTYNNFTVEIAPGAKPSDQEVEIAEALTITLQEFYRSYNEVATSTENWNSLAIAELPDIAAMMGYKVAVRASMSKRPLPLILMKGLFFTYVKELQKLHLNDGQRIKEGKGPSLSKIGPGKTFPHFGAFIGAVNKIEQLADKFVWRGPVLESVFVTDNEELFRRLVR